MGLKSTAVGRRRPVTACAGTGEEQGTSGKSYSVPLLFDAGRNWAFRPTAQDFNPTLLDLHVILAYANLAYANLAYANLAYALVGLSIEKTA